MPLTTIDYPGELAAVVFCQGCPWRCRYCHNPELLDRSRPTSLDWEAVMALLRRRVGLLDAVVFSGGEPTLQRGLAKAMAEVRRLGFKIGLHSAGCYPARLAEVLPLVDWVGMDVKALPGDYPRLTGVPGSGERAWKSLQMLLTSKVSHEVRVTVHDQLMTAQKLKALIGKLAVAGARSIALQVCRARQMLDPSLGPAGADWVTPELLDSIVRSYGQQLVLRV